MSGGEVVILDLRCPRCGSWALSKREVPPAPGSVTVDMELEIRCREIDCGFTIANARDRAVEMFTRHVEDAPFREKLDAESLRRCGLAVDRARLKEKQ